ncbi:c-type cytochrome biogenesis protein CcmI [Simplicispira lacusdiani]|uniref:c-type cytochrome biogenesis protein CcmI n=1 Tax=Simplicispira lacusdiani TaxID=2213010 RepID=UPI000E7157F4|nr:c-type cytochrome biogenesis protein CcmI [Simplicispira lacusdiani]
MSLFIALAAFMTLAAIAWIVLPLLRPAASNGVSSQRLNAAIYRDQLEALDRDLASGAISPADHEATRDELQLRLLDDTAEDPQAATTPAASGFWGSRRMAGLVALLLPTVAAGMYYGLGDPAALNPAAARTANEQQVIQMVESLAAKLKANPDNPKGWAMLARSYKVMGRVDEAEQAYAKAGAALDGNPDLLVDYAELLAVRAQNRMEGRPVELVRKALSIDPDHPSALMMSGVAAYQLNDFDGAVREWEKLLSVLEPGSEDAKMTQENLDEARVRSQEARKSGAKP